MPTTSSMPPLFTSTVTATASSSAAATSSPAAAASSSHHHHGLTGGQIAGIVVGSIVGALLLLALFALCCIWARRRRNDRRSVVFNQPQTQRGIPPPMAYNQQNPSQAGYNPVPGGRVSGFAALQHTSDDSPPEQGESRRYQETSDSDMYGETPERRHRVPPVMGKRGGSLSSNSALGGDETSPSSGNNGQYSSPENMTSAQSEQLPSFEDYYWKGHLIHPGDKVSVLWAYQPRAGDEFELDRGDMLKVIGIWDDGWATGVRIDSRADDYDPRDRRQRDSGVSNGSGRGTSPPASSDIKAFPVSPLYAPFRLFNCS